MVQKLAPGEFQISVLVICTATLTCGIRLKEAIIEDESDLQLTLTMLLVEDGYGQTPRFK